MFLDQTVDALVAVIQELGQPVEEVSPEQL